MMTTYNLGIDLNHNQINLFNYYINYCWEYKREHKNIAGAWLFSNLKMVLWSKKNKKEVLELLGALEYTKEDV